MMAPVSKLRTRTLNSVFAWHSVGERKRLGQVRGRLEVQTGIPTSDLCNVCRLFTRLDS